MCACSVCDLGESCELVAIDLHGPGIVSVVALDFKAFEVGKAYLSIMYVVCSEEMSKVVCRIDCNWLGCRAGFTLIGKQSI